jgi:hypothetical protein
MTLYLVCDVSGSMEADGKPFIMRTLVMAIAQWVRLGYGRADVKLCSWGSDATLLPHWNAEHEYPAQFLVCDGTSSWKPLIHLLGAKPDGKVLLLSDGFWSRDEAKIVKQWKECLQPDTLRMIKTGPDANPQLKGPDVFAAEDLFAALDGWLEGGPA